MTLSLAIPGLAVASLLLASLSVPLLRRLALHVGLVDDPSAGAYKTHVSITPYGGGLAIWIGGVVPLALLTGAVLSRQAGLLRDGSGWVSPWSDLLLFPLASWSPTISELTEVAAGLTLATLMLLLGLVDDRRALTPRLRFVLQILLAVGLVVAVPAFRVPVDLPAAAIGLAALWIVALTNAFNFLDNMNGLAGGLGALTLAGCGGAALVTQHVPVLLLCLALFGACGGFLVHNFPRASIFMGDAGGLFLGSLGGALSLLLCQRLASASPPGLWLAPLALFAVPLYDLITVVGLRLREGRAPWLGDKRHVSHRLAGAGFGRTGAVLLLFGLTALTVLPVVAAVASPARAVPLLGVAAGILLLFGLLDWRLARHAASP